MVSHGQADPLTACYGNQNRLVWSGLVWSGLVWSLVLTEESVVECDLSSKVLADSGDGRVPRPLPADQPFISELLLHFLVVQGEYRFDAPGSETPCVCV